MPTSIAIPNELVDSIIENLHGDDENSRSSLRALQSCALVARAWVRASQRGIFRSILFDPSVPLCAQQLDRLISSFDANSQLATYVKRLVLTNRLRCLHGLEKCMVSVVSRLSQLEEIWFENWDWRAASPPFKRALLHLLRLPSLTTANFSAFEVRGVADLTSLLSNLTHLKSLKIGNIVVWRDWNMLGSGVNVLAAQPLPLPRSIPLIHLDLSDATKTDVFAHWFQDDSCPFGLQNLRALHMGNNRMSWNYEQVASIIRCAAESLQELVIVGPSDKEQSTHAFHLGYAPNIHRLELLELEQSESHTPVPWIESLFEPIINSSQHPSHHYPLRSLTVNLYLIPKLQWPEPSNPVETLPWDEWTAIDRMFENKVFGALKEVVIMLDHISFTRSFTQYPNQRLKDDLGMKLHKVLPFLADSGKLHVKYLEDGPRPELEF